MFPGLKRAMTETTRPASRPSRGVVLRLLGPGLVTGAADDDPSGIATYSQAGAQFGYGLLWTVFLTTPVHDRDPARQRPDRQGHRQGPRRQRHGARAALAGARRWSSCWSPPTPSTSRPTSPRWGSAFAGDRRAQSRARADLRRRPRPCCRCSCPYRRYAPVLKFLTLTLFAYVATAFTVNIPWSTALLATVWPKATINADYFLMVVAVLGTTISPYLFFWQASQEVEEMNKGKIRRPLRELTRGGDPELDRIKIDTTVGMILSNAHRVLHHPDHGRRCCNAARRHQHQFGDPGGRGAAAAGGRFHLRAVRARHHRHRHAGDPGAGGLRRLWRVRSVRLACDARSQGAGRRRLLHHHRRRNRDRLRARLYRHRRHSHAGLERRAQRHRRRADHGDDDGDRRESDVDGTVQGAKPGWSRWAGSAPRSWALAVIALFWSTLAG